MPQPHEREQMGRNGPFVRSTRRQRRLVTSGSLMKQFQQPVIENIQKRRRHTALIGNDEFREWMR
jgi:hypothetical protein